jgi:hypothetical protein
MTNRGYLESPRGLHSPWVCCDSGNSAQDRPSGLLARRERGVSRADIDATLVDNLRRYFSGSEPPR